MIVSISVENPTPRHLSCITFKVIWSKARTALGVGLLFATPVLGLNAASETEVTEKQASETATSTEQAATPAAPAIKLDPFTVRDEPPKLNFDIALQVWSNRDTGKVTAIYITKVKALSHAEQLGLRPRTRIDRIDGIPVEELVASFNDGTVLNKTFVNRKFGDRVTLEVVAEGTYTSKTVTVIEKPPFDFRFRFHQVGPDE